MKYSTGDKIDGEQDDIPGGLLDDSHHRGDVLVFSESVNLTDSQYDGAFHGIETISSRTRTPASAPRPARPW